MASNARNFASLISTGSILSDGAVDPDEITGVTVTAAEINRLSGVTSNVQTQVDSKVNTSDVALSTWSITESNGHLYFGNGSNKLKLDTNGNLEVTGTLDATATIT
jgi:hypothetical protein